MSGWTSTALKFKENCYTGMTDDQIGKLAELFGKAQLSAEQIELMIMAVSVEDCLRGTKALEKLNARMREGRTESKVRESGLKEQPRDEPELSDEELIDGYELMMREYLGRDKPEYRRASLCERRINKIKSGQSGKFTDAERAMFARRHSENDDQDIQQKL